MQETNERLLTDSSAENNLTISPVDNFAFARILSLLDQELISLSAVQIEDGLTATGKQVKVIKGTSRILGMMVPVTITLGEDAGLPFAFLDCEVSGVDLFQLGKTLIPFNIESFKEVSLPFFPKLSLHAAARSGLNSEYLKITAQVPDVWNPLGLEGFSLKDISLNALKEILPISLRYLHSAIFEASLVIKDKVVPVAVTIPLGAKGWRIKVAPSTILPSLADLVGLIAGDDVVNALPEAIRDLPSLKIN
uniref:hypothetical protein n=1 Tax=Chitinophaga sancti TaxID=1004 RepID=UPI003F7ADE51